ncbi:MAG: bifunctional diaminohydroxyphosphoribosylaminopyrimidine deaminase/5-amino-6-(5-phosphoribosylamino)uracil reductase RibD [Deltaproteobacteria bacterium]|nr:bifunctional diaminohydroxyphosphoribosylaminopyrimidine deaminase/5-amino-6-(5-phosphoribosylamino)uracil reductase RibD [Deltaproteobacteria bacterium]
MIDPLIQQDEKFMREALRQARKGLGRTSPNPAVGAVIVRGGRIVSTGYHKRAGAEHAEVVALERLGGQARKGDTLYVTLEPCNHHGRTPPCTEAILKSGIRKLVVGMTDPNPTVRGGGCDFLRERGLEVRVGVLEKECRKLNESFIKFVTTGLPFVIAKSALTLDGWTATATGHARWITNEKSRKFVHRLRDRVDGVMVGIGTVLADDPRLTTRLGNRKGKNPARIIVDTHLRIPPDARVLEDIETAPTILAVGKGVPEGRLEALRDRGVHTIICPLRQGRVDLRGLLVELGKMPVCSLLVEGGATLMGSLIRENLVDKYYIFKAPKILGGDDGVPMASGPGARRMDKAFLLRDIRIRRFGDDVLIRGYPNVHRNR